MRNLLTTSLNRLLSPSRLALLTAAMLLAPCAANATPYVVKLTQQGSNVVATGSGAIDLIGLSFYGDGGQSAASINPAYGYLSIGSPGSIGFYTGLSGPTNFGNSAEHTVPGTGNPVGIFGSSLAFGAQALFVPQGYVSDATLTSGATWDDATFNSLGIIPGTYTWTWGTGTGTDQSFTLETVVSVPEPAVLGLFGLGVLLIGGFVTLRRRDQRQTV